MNNIDNQYQNLTNCWSNYKLQLEWISWQNIGMRLICCQKYVYQFSFNKTCSPWYYFIKLSPIIEKCLIYRRIDFGIDWQIDVLVIVVFQRYPNRKIKPIRAALTTRHGFFSVGYLRKRAITLIQLWQSTPKFIILLMK